MTATAILSAEQLRSVVHYDPETGVFTRTVRLAQRHHVGDRADTEVTGGHLKGYRRVSLFSERHLAHRLAWLYVHGTWPEKHIDHINGVKGDNRIENLREADDKLNIENTRTARADNAIGLLGVHLHKETNRWRARLQTNGKALHLGLFDTPEEAHAAYLVAKRKHHEGCTI